MGFTGIKEDCTSVHVNVSHLHQTSDFMMTQSAFTQLIDPDRKVCTLCHSDSDSSAACSLPSSDVDGGSLHSGHCLACTCSKLPTRACLCVTEPTVLREMSSRKGELRVSVISAKGLRDTAVFGIQDPYVQVYG